MIQVSWSIFSSGWSAKSKANRCERNLVEWAEIEGKKMRRAVLIIKADMIMIFTIRIRTIHCIGRRINMAKYFINDLYHMGA
jgi:hypothetical protein